MAISARNQLQGTVKASLSGAVMAEVVIDVGRESYPPSRSTRSRTSASGVTRSAVIKATEVMVMK
jgi:molybdopterin-binding protein